MLPQEKVVRFSQSHPSIVTSGGYDVNDEDGCEVRQSGLPDNLAGTYSSDRKDRSDVRCRSTDFHSYINTRSSQLFESIDPVVLPLTKDQVRVAEVLNFLKHWYLVLHLLYILLFISIGTFFFYVIEEDLYFIDAFFIATSCVCNCGLQTVDVAEWSTGATLMRHLLMVTGGIVVTSAHQPLLRLWMLRRMWYVFDRHSGDTAGERALRASKRDYAKRLWCTSVICAVTPILYFVIVNSMVMIFIAALNTSGMKGLDVFEIAIGSFHSSIFLPMERYAGDTAIVLFVAVASGLGFTFYPVVLRAFLYIEWFFFRFFAILYMRCSSPDALNARRDSVFVLISESSPLLLNSPMQHVENIFRDGDTFSSVSLNAWDRGFRDILASKQPGTFHAFLFIRNETLYLLAAWIIITIVQAFPFWFQQWNKLLAPYSTSYKFFLSLCQAVCTRFAGASFLSCLEYSTAHVAITILSMFIPALPISTDRTYRKWKQMFRTSLVRLLTSRLFWLFTAMLCILFTEEEYIHQETKGTCFDAMTRTFFEVISAFAGCGFSLSATSSPVSFVGSLRTFSRLVIAVVMIGGRHRTVDLGIDLGFAALQAGTVPVRAQVFLHSHLSAPENNFSEVEHLTETNEDDYISEEK